MGRTEELAEFPPIQMEGTWMSLLLARRIVQGPVQLTFIRHMCRETLKRKFDLSKEATPFMQVPFAPTDLHQGRMKFDQTHIERAKKGQRSIVDEELSKEFADDAITGFFKFWNETVPSETQLANFWAGMNGAERYEVAHALKKTPHSLVIMRILKKLLAAGVPFAQIEAQWQQLNIPEEDKKWGALQLLLSGQEERLMNGVERINESSLAGPSQVLEEATPV